MASSPIDREASYISRLISIPNPLLDVEDHPSWQLRSLFTVYPVLFSVLQNRNLFLKREKLSTDNHLLCIDLSVIIDIEWFGNTDHVRGYASRKFWNKRGCGHSVGEHRFLCSSRYQEEGAGKRISRPEGGDRGGAEEGRISDDKGARARCRRRRVCDARDHLATRSPSNNPGSDESGQRDQSANTEKYKTQSNGSAGKRVYQPTYTTRHTIICQTDSPLHYCHAEHCITADVALLTFRAVPSLPPPHPHPDDFHFE
ncbi:hypothetical protein CEXT_2681 [Caerostris extrusa]|uniref:Uncharacterized protein n=1 Tax=Caerostris extrusa TaxID=172846 RepID=A0AAV4NV45_CAEEX|nr:hypothetical protein CEXT_2681 [Caerostris extrusa]